MRLILQLRSLCMAAFIFFGITNSWAQDGAIKGVIIDEYGLNVPGAAVMLDPFGKATVSDQDGEFTFVAIVDGDYTITVKYLGHPDTVQQASVTGSATTSIKLVLSTSGVQLDNILLVGYGSGSQAKALNTQKNNQNITNVVSTDQIGKFPDANIGDAVKRIPGITMQVDQGEARNIIVRGLAPQLNSVTLNGSRIPSAEGDNRNVQMDLIPADMIQTIEVNKAVTPDMDADALGGSVNLITRSTPQDFRLSTTLGSGISFITDKRILNGSFLVGDRTKDKKFGWMVSASINDNDFGSDNVEAAWSDTFEYNTGVPDTDGNEVLAGVDVNPYTSAFEIRKYLVQRVRRSFSANMDYRLDANNEIFIKTMYNWRDDRENRYVAEYEILDGEDIGADDYTVINGNLTRFPVASARETKGGIPGGRIKNTRLEDQRMQNYSLGGNHLFGTVKFNWMGSFAKASEKRPDERYITYERELIVNNEGSDSRFPLFTPTTPINPEDFELKEITEENQYTEEKDFNAFANFQMPADLFGLSNGSIKFGFRGRLKTKDRNNDFAEYEPVNGLESLADVDTRLLNGDDFEAGSKYRPGIFVTPRFLGSLDLTNPALFEGESLPEEFLGENFDVRENVYAGYVMTTQNFTDKLSVLAGIRLESTHIETSGNEVIFNEDGDFDGTNVLNDESSYTNILPGVHVKYKATENTILRFAWTNTLARPNYVDLVPFREINNADEEIILGNADLDPATSMNFDLMAEQYFQSVGILSGGVFYKNLKDFSYRFIFEDAATGYDVFQPLNGDNASIFGVELALQRQLDFLPSVLKNLSIYLNYTHISSKANGIRNEDGDERGNLDLPGATPNLFNASLGYGDDLFSARLSSNFSDAYLDELGGNDFEDRYYDKQFFLDFNATVTLSKSLRVYVDLNNITNQPLRYYQGILQRTQQVEYYNRRLTFGLKYDLY